MMEPCFPGVSSERISCFALLARTAYALPIKLSLSQPMGFLTFTLLILSPLPTGAGSERAAVWCFSCPLGLNHDKPPLH